MPTERRNFKNIIDAHQVWTSDGTVEGAKKVDIGSPGPLGSSQSGWPEGIVRPKPFGRSHSTNRCVFYWWTRLFFKRHFFFIWFYIVGRILVGNPLSLQVKFRSKMNKTKRIICSSCCRRWILYINYKPTVIWQYLEYYVYMLYNMFMHIIYLQYIVGLL